MTQELLLQLIMGCSELTVHCCLNSEKNGSSQKRHLTRTKVKSPQSGKRALSYFPVSLPKVTPGLSTIPRSLNIVLEIGTTKKAFSGMFFLEDDK